MWEFTSPRTIVFGEGSLEFLKELDGKRAFIVAGRSVKRLGVVDRVTCLLSEAGFRTEVFDEVEPEPSLDTITRAAEAATRFQPDIIVGLGGGSSMDAAKAIWAAYERPDIPVEAINPLEKMGLRAKARLVCIPTTSGSGSEANWGTLVTDLEGRVKMEIASKELVPDIVISDPELPGMMPPQLAADTGMDALAHAVEAYVSQWHNDFSDAVAVKAIQMIFTYLPESCATGSLEAREKVQNAATMAGMAIGNSHVGAAHAMAHSLGAVFKLPHGNIVGIFLPHAIEFNAGTASDRFGDIARAIGIPFEQPGDAGRELAKAVRGLMGTIGQVLSIKELGVSEDEFLGQIDGLVERAAQSSCTLTNPRNLSVEEYRELFLKAFEG